MPDTRLKERPDMLYQKLDRNCYLELKPLNHFHKAVSGLKVDLDTARGSEHPQDWR